MTIPYITSTINLGFSPVCENLNIRALTPQQKKIMAIVSVVFVLIGIIVASFLSEWKRKKYNDLLLEGSKFKKQGQYEKANIQFKKALKIYPEDLYCLSEYGGSLRGQRKYEEAAAQFKKCLEKDPQNTKYLKNYCAVLKEFCKILCIQKKYAEADKQYKIALEANPKDAEILVAYGKFLIEQGRNNEADIHFEKVEVTCQNAVKKTSKNTRERGNAQEAYGELLMNWGRQIAADAKFAKAEKAFQKALEANPTDTQIMDDYACLLQNIDRHAEAELLNHKLCLLKPRYARLIHNYAVTLFAQDKFLEAITQFEKCLELEPHNDVYLNNYCRVLAEYSLELFRQRKFEEACIQCKKALVKKPDSVGLLKGYGRFLFNYGKSLKNEGKSEEAAAQFAKVEEHCNKALKIRPEDDVTKQLYNAVLAEQGKKVDVKK